MANQKKEQDISDTLSNKSSLAIYGISDEISKESDDVLKIIKNTMKNTADLYGANSSGKIVDYFNEVNFSQFFADNMKENSNSNKSKEEKVKVYKKYMEDNGVDVSSLLISEKDRIMAYKNYSAIYEHIPECAQALDVYKDNIMSPDDLTKIIFNLKYKGDGTVTGKDIKKKVEERLKTLEEKYNIDDLADEVISSSLMTGDCYVACLSLNKELEDIITDPVMKNNNLSLINESYLEKMDVSQDNLVVDKSDISLNESAVSVLNEIFNKEPKDDKENKANIDTYKEIIEDAINNNISIGSPKELLTERMSYELSNNVDNKKIIGIQTSDINTKKSKKGNSKKDNEPLYISGSSVKVLDPKKVVELAVDNICYGYYYVNAETEIPNSTYLGTSSGREVMQQNNLGSNIINTNNTKFTPVSNASSILGTSEEKLNIISKIFIDVIAKKVNKDFIRYNKDFKNLIYSLLKQDYIIKKQVKFTFFTNDEIIAFKVPALYRKIVFFAKLYLATLTNALLIKLGRSHDKRVIYVDVGADEAYEQAITQVIQDFKTKEFKMDNINGDINTILRLNPGSFDDYYIPQVNGERPIDIETLQGMDVNLNDEFLEWLKKSMLNGIGVPPSLIDSLENVDYARTLSAQNANFLRSVIKYQKKYTKPFSILFRKLYDNEFKFSSDKKEDKDSLDINTDLIMVEFPSPATLNSSNLSDQIQVANGNADTILNALEPQKLDGSNNDEREIIRGEILKDLLPAVDWEKYKKILNTKKMEIIKNNVSNPPAQEDNGGQQPY